MFKQMQRLGKAFMLPIAILPAAGLLLGIGGALSNANTVAAYPMLSNEVLQAIFQVMAAAGTVVFANLAMVMAVGLAVGLAKVDKGVAALAAMVAFLVMNATAGAWLKVFNPDGMALDTGVVGAIVVAVTVTWLHGRYADIQVPSFLGFFGGSRFVPIVTAFAGLFVGAMFFLIWPPIQNALVSAGEVIAGWGAIGTFFYGFLMRLCGAVGLHHMIYPMFWYTALGGSELVNGVQVVGAQNIFFAQLADPNQVLTALQTIAARHQSALDRMRNTRQMMFRSNAGICRFETAGGRITAIGEVWTSAIDPDTQLPVFGPYMLHRAELDPVADDPPSELRGPMIRRVPIPAQDPA